MSKKVWGIIIGFGSLITIIGGVWIAMHVFAEEVDSIARFAGAKTFAAELSDQVTEKLDEFSASTQASFRDIQLSRLRQDLRKLGKRYGTTDCDKISQISAVDGDECRWLKDEIAKLTGN